MRPTYPPRTGNETPDNFPLPLLNDEEVISEIEPDPRRLRRYLSISANAIAFVSFSCWAPIMVVAPLAEEKLITSVATGILAYGALMAACQFLFYIIAAPLIMSAARKYKYWATNRRIVTRTGIIGYKISSIPLERITDVTVSRSLLVMITKAPVLIIRDMAANNHWRGPRWIGVPEPEQVQHEILEAVGEVNASVRRF